MLRDVQVSGEKVRIPSAVLQVDMSPTLRQSSPDRHRSHATRRRSVRSVGAHTFSLFVFRGEFHLLLMFILIALQLHSVLLF